MPLFSVIIPTRDRFNFLEEAIASVLAQTCDSYELVIVNDGYELSRLPSDPRIRQLENARRGAVPARNLGVTEARGEFIAFLDDDDQWTDQFHLSKSLEAFRSGADFYFADGIMPVPGESAPRPFSFTADVKSLEYDNTILISAVCYRRALHQNLGLFDEALPYYWDWDWYLRVARGGNKLHHHAHPAVDIRIHAQNMSGQNNQMQRQRNLDLFADKHNIGPLQLKNHLDFTHAR